MQDFHADCIIYILVKGFGRPQKYSWVAELRTRNSVNIVRALKFEGISSFEDSEANAIHWALQQSNLLLQEKIEIKLLSDFDFGPVKPSRNRSQALSLKRKAIAKLWEEFRLKKVGRLTSSEEQSLSQCLEESFSPGRKRK